MDVYATCTRCGSYMTALMRELDCDDEEQVLIFMGDICKHCDTACSEPSCMKCQSVRYGRHV